MFKIISKKNYNNLKEKIRKNKDLQHSNHLSEIFHYAISNGIEMWGYIHKGDKVMKLTAEYKNQECKRITSLKNLIQFKKITDEILNLENDK